jgi:methylated-DNA-protein-cysteine methyltransferase-like protein
VRSTKKGSQNQTGFFQEVYRVVRQIPRGKVASYGQVARLAGNPRASRAVGWALHVNPQPGTIPCHRVVNRQGRLAPGFAFGGEDVQRRMLEAEGVFVGDDYCLDMKRYAWDGRTAGEMAAVKKPEHGEQ